MLCKYFPSLKSFLLVFLLNSLPLISQQKLSFEHITTAQGLSRNSINCIFEDRQGFMWFGTTGGINRYDGFSFIAYKFSPNDSNSLSDDNVKVFTEDADGYFWIGTNNGLNCLNPITGKLKRYYVSHSQGLYVKTIQALFVDTLSSSTKNGKLKVI